MSSPPPPPHPPRLLPPQQLAVPPQLNRRTIDEEDVDIEIRILHLWISYKNGFDEAAENGHESAWFIKKMYLDLHKNQRLPVVVKEQIYDDDSADNDDADM